MRKAAEVQLAHTPIKLVYRQSPKQLLHDLQVHQIELEMQNDELRRAMVVIEEMRDSYVDLYEMAPVGYLTLSREGRINKLNLTGAALLGVNRKAILNRFFASFITPEDGDLWHRFFQSVLKRDGRQHSELQLQRGNGSRFYASINALKSDDLLSSHRADDPAITTDKANQSDLLRMTITDITEKKRAEANIRVAATVFDSQEGMTVTDVEGTILSVNQAFTDITGYTAEEAVGNNTRMLSSGLNDAAFYAEMWKSIHDTGKWEGDIWNRRKNKDPYLEHLIVTAVKYPDGTVTNYVGTLTDITVSSKAAAEIQNLAFYDPLTQLPNRRLLQDRVNQALASCDRNGQTGALLFIDLDNFKSINDSLGHAVGDKLLKEVAERLKSCVRAGDTVARMGGDEFVVMLEDLSKLTFEAATQAEATGEKILTTLNQLYRIGRKELHNSASIGITLLNSNQREFGELYQQADIAMYQAKKAGRNTLRFFDPNMQQVVNARSALEGELHKAIEYHQFFLYYQIQVENTQRPTGAEALIRWVHPTRNLVSPTEFIPIAEETGLIIPIGTWVLETACAQLKTWEGNALTRDLILSVNVSAKQIHQTDFAAKVQAIVQHHGINPKRLKLELTESILLDNMESIIATMNEISALGVCFSLDDFGTGYSSLQYLKKLPLHQLKIDQSFVRDLAIDSNDRAIVHTIIAMAQSLNLDVIAEGVETEEQRQLLEIAGCVHYQGYLFGKPVPIEEFEAKIIKGSSGSC
jgi:diguanylate cyclase (GGDEF)-like protein/PAS domain S-box-containing protein